jgi:hypothetical protein
VTGFANFLIDQKKYGQFPVLININGIYYDRSMSKSAGLNNFAACPRMAIGRVKVL